jgi:PAS domain-containing protein
MDRATNRILDHTLIGEAVLTAAVAVFVSDDDGNYIAVNDAAEQMLGYSREDGQSWTPLSPAYAVEKARTDPGRSILIREGDMRRAASQPRRESTPRTLTLWIDDPKAPLHQEGSDRLPARPLIPDPLPVSARRDIDHAAEEYVSTLVRGSASNRSWPGAVGSRS